MSYKLLKNNVKTAIGIAPIDNAAGTVTGVEVDRKGFETAICYCSTGLVSGAPSAQSTVFTVQHSSTSGSGYVTASLTGTITADSTGSKISVDLNGLNRYIKVVAVLTLTGGSSPKQDVAAIWILGSPKVEPAE